MPMRGLCSFLARSGRNLLREPATITRSAGEEVTLRGRLDAANPFKDAAFVGCSSSTTKAWAGGSFSINKTPAPTCFAGFARVSSNAVGTRRLNSLACTAANVGFSRIPKAASSNPFSLSAVKSLRWSLRANAKSYHSDMSGAPRRSGFKILVISGGTYLGIKLGIAYMRTRDPSKPGIDWVVLGATPPVVADHKIGHACCWAIVSVQNAEAVLKIFTGQDIRLSMQEIIDCCGEPDGAGGGYLSEAFEHMKNNGLAAHSSYPINPSLCRGPCNKSGKPRAVWLADFEEIPGAVIHDYGKKPTAEERFKFALLESPISVAFFANDFFQNYTGNAIIEYDQCPPPPPGKQVNHALLLVGFGTDRWGNDYWLVQNVYGRWWGHNGFAKIRRGDPDPRGVGGMTSHPAFRPIMTLEN